MECPAVIKQQIQVFDDPGFIGWVAVGVSVVACNIGLEPGGVLEHIVLFHSDNGLDVEVTSLAQGDDVPPFAILRI
jgi:hypothetical protein